MAVQTITGTAQNGSTLRLVARVLLAQLTLNVALINSLVRLPDDMLVFRGASVLPELSAFTINLILVWGAVVLVMGYRVRITAAFLAVLAATLLHLACTTNTWDVSIWNRANAFSALLLGIYLMLRGSGDYTLGWFVASVTHREWRDPTG